MSRLPYDSEKNRDHIVQSLQNLEFKVTPQREDIIDILARDRSHPGAMAIYRQARKKNPRISLSTVYLTLSLLKELQLIKELEFDERENRYDANTANHVNLVCAGCGRIEDFEETRPISAEKVARQMGFRTYDTRLEYYGYCGKCAAKE
jgi:Fur family peroxide stress response transcriptional regulator